MKKLGAWYDELVRQSLRRLAQSAHLLASRCLFYPANYFGPENCQTMNHGLRRPQADTPWQPVFLHLGLAADPADRFVVRLLYRLRAGALGPIGTPEMLTPSD